MSSGIRYVAGNTWRWARIATAAFLYDCGFPVGPIIRKTDKQAYIAALNRAIDNGESGDLAQQLAVGYQYAMQRRNR